MQDATKISRGNSCKASEEKELVQQENIAGDRGHFSRSQQCPAPRVDGAWSMPHASFNPKLVTGRLLLDFFFFVALFYIENVIPLAQISCVGLLDVFIEKAKKNL